MDEQALYRLMSWLTPENFFAGQPCCQGLEFAVETGLVRDATSLVGWIIAILSHGAAHIDAVLFRAAYDAAALEDAEYLAEIAQMAAGMLTGMGVVLASAAMGGAFLAMVQRSWPDPALDCLFRFWEGPVVHPVAVAAACAAGPTCSRIPLRAALTAYLQVHVAHFVQVGMDLLRLTPAEAPAIHARLEQPTLEAVDRALAAELNALGLAPPILNEQAIDEPFANFGMANRSLMPS